MTGHEFGDGGRSSPRGRSTVFNTFRPMSRVSFSISCPGAGRKHSFPGKIGAGRARSGPSAGRLRGVDGDPMAESGAPGGDGGVGRAILRAGGLGVGRRGRLARPPGAGGGAGGDRAGGGGLAVFGDPPGRLRPARRARPVAVDPAGRHQPGPGGGPAPRRPSQPGDHRRRRDPVPRPGPAGDRRGLAGRPDVRAGGIGSPGRWRASRGTGSGPPASSGSFATRAMPGPWSAGSAGPCCSGAGSAWPWWRSCSRSSCR